MTMMNTMTRVMIPENTLHANEKPRADAAEDDDANGAVDFAFCKCLRICCCWIMFGAKLAFGAS